ncbi:MAG: hypothetical protein PHD97_07540 [Bacteroidales bacterium]|nr:hypothetical protein [Bacteroidales bacterium]
MFRLGEIEKLIKILFFIRKDKLSGDSVGGVSIPFTMEVEGLE